MFTYETGTFIVDSQGEVDVDFLFDGGSFQGELGIFSLEGMDSLEPGSTEFMLEAAQRVSSNSTQGHIVIDDAIEGARFEGNLGYEANFNRGEYQNVKTFEMIPGDEVGFLLLPNSSFAETLRNPDNIAQSGQVISVSEANQSEFSSNGIQFVDVDGNGTVGVTDLPINRSNQDYNDIVYQVQGLQANLPPIENQINSNLDWRTTPVGQRLLNYASRDTLNEEAVEQPEVVERPEVEGIFEVGDTGEVMVDYLFDGGFFQGEVGIFSLENLNPEDFGSEAFTQEVIDRVQSNSPRGYTVVTDAEEGARFSAELEWESDFNRGEHAGKQTLLMNPEDTFGLVLVSNGTFDELSNNSSTSEELFFSISEANTNGQAQVTGILTTEENAIISFEDTLTSLNSNDDYNDIILALEGSQAIGVSAIEDVVADNRNWLDTEVGEDILGYFDNADLS